MPDLEDERVPLPPGSGICNLFKEIQIIPEDNCIFDKPLAALSYQLLVPGLMAEFMVVVMEDGLGKAVSMLEFVEFFFNCLADLHLIHVAEDKKRFYNLAEFLKRFVKGVLVGVGIEPLRLSERKLGALLVDMRKGDILLVSELSRLGRSVMEVMSILHSLMEKDVKVFTTKERYELGNNIKSKVLAFAFSLSAEIERSMISDQENLPAYSWIFVELFPYLFNFNPISPFHTYRPVRHVVRFGGSCTWFGVQRLHGPPR